ncbi:MAG TPA: hypothetical protein VKX40_00255 [Aequorivita sp.]|nr:hypothetical protein [Aequorivita sp.]
MRAKFILIFLIISGNILIGQNKKELRSTVVRLQSDSTLLERKLADHSATITNLNLELTKIKDLNADLNKQIEVLGLEKKVNARLSDSVTQLKETMLLMNMRLDSIHRYSRIIDFVEAFYNSLELSDEENLRQYEFGDVKFDLDNFNSLISKNARYSMGRVKNLSDEKLHNKYFIMLENIDEIRFSLDKILVKTRVMYSGERMGLFYNEEQLTIRDNKGVLKMTDWVDLDLYKMAPTLEFNVENFTREDFYKWLDGTSK